MDMAAKPKGTQPGHAVTDHSNHTKAITKAEKALESKVKSGAVKDIAKAKEAIAKKTGVWPNGYTN